MKTLKITLLFTFAVGLLIFSSCKDNSVSQEPPPEEEGVATVDTVSATPEDQPADSGEVGLVINTREISRKGYTPAEAEVTFPNYSTFNETLEIDPVTSIAVLSISNEDLTEEEKNAFASGIAAEIVIYGADQTQLAEYYDPEQVLDDSGSPLNITNDDLEYNVPPLTLKEGIPYYIQPHTPIPGDGTFEDGSVMKAQTGRLYDFIKPSSDSDWHFDFYFIPLPADNTYLIKRGGQAYYLYDNAGTIDVTTDSSAATEFKLVQDQSGWARIREAGTSKYMNINDGTSATTSDYKALRMQDSIMVDSGHRFRFISANIEWSASDRGTEYHEPITPPATVDFSFATTYVNCSQGMVTQTVGSDETRTSARAIASTESMELFGSVTSSIDVSIGASVGGDLYGASANVNVTAGLEVSTSVTKTNAQTLSKETSKAVSVSSTRTIEIPPGTGTEVYDVVRTVENARVPYTQVVRLKAKYTNGPALTGDEIRTQMMLNQVSGIPIATGSDYVDVGLQGSIDISDMYSYEGKADNIPDACN